MRARRAPGAALLVAALSIATACSSLPTSGPVMEGGGGEDRREIVIAPRGPAPGVSPLDLVYGFLGAGVGAEEGFATARAYLTPASGARWAPTERVVVHRHLGVRVSLNQAGAELPDDARPDPAAGPLTATVRVPALAVVDADGRYRATAPDESVEEEVPLVLTDGQWRLGAVPDQLFVDEDDFRLLWSARTLYFPDQPGTALVPEVRWFPPLLEALPTAVATELLQGPSPWLAPAVRRRLVPRAELSSASVTVEGGTAQVDLDAGVLDAGIEDRALLVASLDATLSPLPGIFGVVVTAGGGRLSGTTPEAPPQPSPTVDPSPVLLRDGAPVRHSPQDGSLVPVTAPLGDGVAGGLSDPAVPGDPASRALLAVLVRGEGGTTTLVRWGRGGAGRPVVEAEAPASLTAPAFDPQGWLWSAATSGDAGVSAVPPDGGRAVAVAAPWLAGRTIVAVQPSREGARALVVSSVPGEDGDRVDVVGVRRGTGGAPESLVEPDEEPAPVPQAGAVVDATWVDQSTVAVLGTPTRPPTPEPFEPPQGQATYRQVLTITGGVVEPLGAPGLFDRRDGDAPPPKVVSLAAGDGATTLLLGTSDGLVYQRAGLRWIVDPSLEGATDPSYPG